MVFGQPKDIPEFIILWAEKYKNKYGIMPNRCHINPSYAEIVPKIDEIMVIRDKYVPNCTFWFSRSNTEC
jgi:hypothetical protein